MGPDNGSGNGSGKKYLPGQGVNGGAIWDRGGLPVAYYHVVFTLPAPISDIAYHNKAVLYAILFSAAAETLITIAADPKHLGARIGLTAVLHTWGSALTHHPHAHCIVPGGGNGQKLGQVTKVKLSDRIRRIELIGKHVNVQAFAERKEIGGIGGGPLKVEDLSTTEAARLILATLREAAEAVEK